MERQQEPIHQERIVAYEPSFDRKAYETKDLKDREKLDAYTKTQLETHLGERFNVLLSTTRYEIKNEKIYGENTNEPFMQILQRGVDYRHKFGNFVDWKREEAEVESFNIIEKTLLSKDARVGEMMLLVSPPGGENSIYKHNFYDVFSLKEDEKGKYIEAIRYSSSLTNDEYAQKLKPIKDFGKDVKDFDFLASPIKVDAKFKSADDVHKYLHKNHEFITKEEFDQITAVVAPLITSYINTLSEKPFDQRLQLLTYNAILNKADIVLSLVRHKDKQKLVRDYIIQSQMSAKTDIFMFGNKPVRVVSTGCGSSGGFNVTNNLNVTFSPFSVSEFANKKNQEWFSCPKCNYKANGPVGNICPGCRLTKEEFAESGGEIC